MTQVFYLMAVIIKTQRWNTAAARMAQRRDQSDYHHLHHFTCTSLAMPAKRYSRHLHRLCRIVNGVVYFMLENGCIGGSVGQS